MFNKEDFVHAKNVDSRSNGRWSPNVPGETSIPTTKSRTSNGDDNESSDKPGVPAEGERLTQQGNWLG